MTGPTERPQYFENNLQPIKMDRPSLLVVLAQLRKAIQQGIAMIETSYPPPSPADEKAYGSICNGHLGIALMYLRLNYQAEYLGGRNDGIQLRDYYQLARARINPCWMDLDAQPGRLSPVGSAMLGAVAMRLFSSSLTTRSMPMTEAQNQMRRNDIKVIKEIIEIALEQAPAVSFRGHLMGGDEVMFGRTGLLWTITNLQACVLDSHTKSELEPIFQAIPKLVDAIVDAGRVGAQEYLARHGDGNALPLMWLWFDGHYGLGGMHGATGILSVLLFVITNSAVDSPTRKDLPLVADTIADLCKFCVSHDGHLPMSSPEFPSKTGRGSPLVQICHGTTGLLYLLAQAKNIKDFVKTYWTSDYDDAIKLGSQKIWEEGLLSKSGGNAWPWLILHNTLEYDDDAMAQEGSIDNQEPATRERTTMRSANDSLSKALAFLLETTKTQPFNDMGRSRYCVPDNPYSLYEGLAGTICASAEACAVIVARLHNMTLDERLHGERGKDDDRSQEHMSHQLGFPMLGSARLTGIL